MNRKYIAIYVTVLLLTMFSCVESKQKEAEVETEEQAETPIFEKGNLTSKEKFVGDVYMNLLFPKIQPILQNQVVLRLKQDRVPTGITIPAVKF